MKNIPSILTVATLLLVAACTKDNNMADPTPAPQAIPIPNGDFESWPFQRPEYWQNNSCPYCAQPIETYIVQQDSNPPQGLFAAKFIYNNVYPAYAENRFAVPTHPVTLTAYVKCDLYGTDSVYIKINVLNNSTVVDSGQWIGTTSIGNYSQVTIPITQSFLQADTAVIYIQGGHKQGYPLNNTILWVDDLHLQ